MALPRAPLLLALFSLLYALPRPKKARTGADRAFRVRGDLGAIVGSVSAPNRSSGTKRGRWVVGFVRDPACHRSAGEDHRELVEELAPRGIPAAGRNGSRGLDVWEGRQGQWLFVM